MFPPIDQSVLDENEDFAQLYNTLTTVVLNPDCTSKASAEAHEAQAIQEELDKHRLREARRHLLTAAIANAVPENSPAEIPTRPTTRRTAPSLAATPSDDVLDLLLLLPSLLSPTDLPSAETTLLLSAPPLSDVDQLLPAAAPLVSSALQTSALGIARIANPATNPSFLHGSIATLPGQHMALVESLETQRAALAKLRLQTCDEVLKVLDRRADALCRLVGALEAKHTAIARSLENTAEELALRAQKAEAEAQLALVRVRREIYSREVRSALGNYKRHLMDAKIRIEGSIRAKRMEIAEYGVGVKGQEKKEKLMRELGNAYREMDRQMGEVEEDLGRLRR